MNASTIESFQADNLAVIRTLAAVWNDACGPLLAVSERLIAYNTRPATGAAQAGQIARVGDEIVGFVLASTLPSSPTVAPASLGWIDAIAVRPAAQRQGMGSRLLAWAEDWLRAQGCTKARLGAGLHPFVPGLPVELGDAGFFERRGYRARAGSASVWDVARDLGDFATHYGPSASAEIRPMRSEDTHQVRAFLQREFPNRWLFEFEEFLGEEGRPSDYVLLVTASGVEGFARLTLEDSERPIDRFRLHGLPRPWGQLGPIGVSKAARGQGYGGRLLDRGLMRLHESGVRGCVIDWTDLVDFYAKFGFRPYREYRMLGKDL